MASLPRIITVDPTGNIPTQVRAAFDLLDRLVVQIDVPGPTEALEELERGGIDVVVAAWNPGNGIQGWELAANIKQVAENVSIILMGDYEDTDLDDEMAEQSPFVYLKRPFDVPQLIRVLQAALDGGDLQKALRSVSGTGADVANPLMNMGPVPQINAERADEVMQGVMSDLNPIGATLATREGQIVVGRTTMGDLDYDDMALRIATTLSINISLRDTIGGNTQSFQFYDGDDYDIFVLSVGLHHFLTLVFDGKEGARQLGPVSRFGRRRAEDLIAVIGPSAFFIQAAAPPEKPAEVRRKSDQTRKYATQETEIPELARAELGSSDEAAEVEEAQAAAPSEPLFDAISDDEFDADALFGDDFDEGDADDLFSLDALENLAQDDGQKGTLDWDRARELGILDE